MTTDPNRPSDPMEPPPSTPPPSTPPPVDADDPVGAAPPTSPGYVAAPTGATGYPPPAPSPVEDYAAPPPETPAYGTTPPAAAVTSASSVSFDRAKVSTLDLGLGAAAILYLIALVLPWVSVSSELAAFDDSGNGFSSGSLVFALILLIAAAVVALLPAVGTTLKLPFPSSYLLLGLTGLAALLTLIQFIDVLGAGDDFEGLGVEVSTGIGAWLGMLVAIAAVILAVLAFRAPNAEQHAV